MDIDPAHYIVLIPAYKPDSHLIDLVRALKERGLPTLLVDDGGGERFRPVFETCAGLDAVVVRHAVNLGKGRALKTGLNEVLLRFPQAKGVITADADGQHTPDDIFRLIEEMGQKPDTLVLGSRAFTGTVPLKSRAGNAITRVVYTLATGAKVFDTQTGLRGIPVGRIPAMMALPGERYEYEMNMLLKVRELSLPVHEMPIETVYIDNNSASHFNPLKDGAKIYAVILRFAAASLFCFGVDYLLYVLLDRLTGQQVMAYLGARLVSAFLNYQLNRHTVFKGQGGKGEMLRYALLAGVQGLAGAGITKLLTLYAWIPAGLAKLPADLLLFFLSYIIQRDFVFKRRAA